MLDWEMRIEAGKRLVRWGIVPVGPDHEYGMGDDPVYQHLAWLLGYDDGLQFMFEFRESDREKLRWLCSPYGLTVYKMMVLRKHEDGDV